MELVVWTSLLLFSTWKMKSYCLDLMIKMLMLVLFFLYFGVLLCEMIAYVMRYVCVKGWRLRWWLLTYQLNLIVYGWSAKWQQDDFP